MLLENIRLETKSCRNFTVNLDYKIRHDLVSNLIFTISLRMKYLRTE